MQYLPLIIGFGGINAAGRSANHYSYRRTVLDALSTQEQTNTLLDLAVLMNLVKYQDNNWSDSSGNRVSIDNFLIEHRETILADTLVRKLIANHSHHAPYKDLVHSAAQVPAGFDPGLLYNSRNHPRSLQLTVYGASDALGFSGIPLEDLKQIVAPNQIGVFASNSLASVDNYSLGGLFHGYLADGKVNAKQLPLAYGQMPADFINAYLLGSLGTTGGQMGACATFLYNLSQATQAITTGKIKFAIVGTSDAPIVPEIIDGFRTIGALIEDHQLAKLSGGNLDYTTASRPFGNNAGFVLAEAAQFIILASDDLVVELGAQIFGIAGEVFINADGHKTSITAPGVGNYLTMAQACVSAKKHFGSQVLANSMVHAHGSSTPQNRVTESHILNEIAKVFGISAWPVVAIKSYLGHTQGTASGDQLISTLGTWQHGIIPGITTIEKVADDVENSNLNISCQHTHVEQQNLDVAILNAKGFGGNNASGVVASPLVAKKMLEEKYTAKELVTYNKKCEQTVARSQAYISNSQHGNVAPIYHFNKESVLDFSHIDITDDTITIEGWKKSIDLL